MVSDTNATYNKMKQELEELRAKLDWLDNSFLLEPSIDVKKAYGYLKENPSGVRFVYKKYPNLRPILREISDPENPLYLESVADRLKDLIELTDAKEDLEAINRERSDLRNKLNDIKRELGEKNKELDSLESQVPELTKQIDDMHKVFGNLSQEETITRIKSFYESVGTFVHSVLESQKKQPISESFNSARLDLNQLNVLRMLQKTAKADLDFLLNEDLLSEANLDKKRQEIKEKMEKEMAEGETSMLAFTEHNPLKTLNKSLKAIETAKDQLEKAGDFSPESGWYYHIHTIPNVQRILDVPRDLLENLIQQVSNVNARKVKQ